MPVVAEVTNIFEPQKEAVRNIVPAGWSIREVVNWRLGDGQDFDYPTIALLQGDPVMRKDWETTMLGEKDVLEFFQVPGELGTIALIISGVMAVWTILSMPSIPARVDEDQAESSYSLRGQKNQIKLQQPIPCPYGRNRIFPPYAARDYSKFSNDDQILYQLFCIGQGEYGSLVHQIEDSPISSFSDVTIEVYGPGDPVTLFPDNVETSAEVSAIELFGTNESDFEIAGPFTANAVGTTTTKIEVDVVFPGGLYLTEDNGSFSALTVTVLFQYRAIDDAGAPTGAGTWSTLDSFSKTLASNKPHRVTVARSVSSGRYEVRAQRTNVKNLSTMAVSTVQWYQMRAILPSTKNYGDVTLVAMSARATNNLNSQTRSLYNVIATRKLPIWNGSSFDAVAETRNPVWAYVDALRAVYGANLANSKIDLAGLLTLAGNFTTDSVNFDYIFEKRTSIWNALTLIGQSCGSAPVINLTQFSLVRDVLKTVPVIGFSQNSIIKDSLQYNVQLQSGDDYDGIEIEYFDETTFKQETVDCLIGKDAGVNTNKIKFPGIINRDKAYQAGLKIRAEQIFQRETINFKTGLDGSIPSFGDYVVLSHDVPRWGNAGIVGSIAADNKTVTLSRSLSGVNGNSIAFRDKYGEVEGPYSCSKVAGNDFQIITDSPITQTNFLFDDASDPPAYYFGETGKEYKELLVTSATTSNDDTVSITCRNYDARIYSFSNRTAPAIGSKTVPSKIPALPVVSGLVVNNDTLDITLAVVSWEVALGAAYYVVETSLDATNWDAAGVVTTTFLALTVAGGTLYVRVAGVNIARGAWSQITVNIGNTIRVTSSDDRRITSGGDRRVTYILGTIGPAVSTILNGSGAPSDSVGANGDFYIDTTADDIYGPKSSGSWGASTSIVGSDGINGNTILSGSGVPSNSLGVAGDYYQRTDTAQLYGPKVVDANWDAASVITLPGADGKTVLNGSGAPSDSLGENGDFYLDTTGDFIYGPKTGGSWGASTSIIGGTGISGLSVSTLLIYKRSATLPTTPTGGSYVFETALLTPPSGWSASPTTADGTAEYLSKTTAAITGVTGTDSTLTWNTPIKHVEKIPDNLQGGGVGASFTSTLTEVILDSFSIPAGTWDLTFDGYFDSSGAGTHQVWLYFDIGGTRVKTYTETGTTISFFESYFERRTLASTTILYARGEIDGGDGGNGGCTFTAKEVV
jgi:hypothetical protein